jgi:hypothetical protein
MTASQRPGGKGSAVAGRAGDTTTGGKQHISRRLTTRVSASLVLLAALALTISVTGCGSATTSSTSTPVSTAPPGPGATIDAARADRLTAAAFDFIELLASGRFDEAYQAFDDTMKQALPPEALQETWASVERQVGSYVEPIAVREEASGGFVAIVVQVAFADAPLDVRVVFDGEDSIAGLFFQPAQTAYENPPYSNPDAFTERKLTVVHGSWELPATLTLPTGPGPFPGLVLVHGSGPQDRDETIGPNKPFRDLAEGLATAGIAVLRYEKRTLHYAGEAASFSPMTVQEETIDDALAAVATLRDIPEVPAEAVFLLGHSLGGTLAPRIGLSDPSIAGFVILAGAARPLEDLILEQTRYLHALEEQAGADEEAALAELEEQVARVKDPALSEATPASSLPLGIPAAYWLDLRGYDPPSAAHQLARPLLVLQGERDYQVTDADFALWQEALSSAPQAELHLYPELNHLFVSGEGPSRPLEYLRPGHVDAEVIEDIARFILETTAVATEDDGRESVYTLTDITRRLGYPSRSFLPQDPTGSTAS